MKKRRLGKSGPEVSTLGYGVMGNSFGYGPPVDRQCLGSQIKWTRLVDSCVTPALRSSSRDRLLLLP